MANENNNQNNDGTVWAIVDTGTLRLLGKIPDSLVVGHVVDIEDALILQCLLVPVQLPTGQIAEQMIQRFLPVDGARDSVCIRGLIQNVRYLSDMPDKGETFLEKHAQFKDMLTQGAAQDRARAAGIELVSSLPKGPRLAP